MKKKYMCNVAMLDRDQVQADPVYLLQSRRAIMISDDFPEGWWRDEDWHLWKAEDEEPTIEDLVDHELAEVAWDTVYVFYDRDEAEQFAKARDYRWPDGYRVYSVSAKGDLKKILEAEDFRRANA